MNAVGTRIAQRYDVLSNWQQTDPILLNGEIAVVSTDNYIKFKVGNGVSSFSQLPYSDTNLSVNSLAIGWQNVAGQQSMAVGYDVSATGQRAAAFGYTADASDNGSFVFNGDNSYPVVSAYESHGVGTFNLNLPNGLSSIYIGQDTLADTINKKSTVMFVDWE